MTVNGSKAVKQALMLSAIVCVLDIWVGYVLFSGLFAVMSLMLAPIYIVLAIFKIGRSTTKGLGILLLCPIVPTFCGQGLDSDAMTQAEPIVQAIKLFKTNRGNYPSSLEELVPEYVNSIADLSPTGPQRKLEYRTEHLGSVLYFETGLFLNHRAYRFWDDRWVQNA